MAKLERRELKLPSQLVRPALALVRDRGGDARDYIERHGLPANADSEREIVVRLDVLRRFLDDVSSALSEPHLGLTVAERTERGTWDLLEYSCRAAPNVREALRRMARYVRLANDVVQIRFVETDDGAASIEQAIPGNPVVLDRHGNEFFAATVVLKCRELAGRKLVPTRLVFAHPAPDDFDRLYATFGTRAFEFAPGRNAVFFDEHALSAPLESSDASLSSILERFAVQALESRGQTSAFVASVRDAIRAQLLDGTAVLGSTAKGLGVTVRTLQRRLAEEGSSFAEEVESVREELARLYVSDRSRPLTEVAFLLGYSDLSTFVRAFRRWTGMTPARFRVNADTRT
jgi:AraC-like DNA-binding protein